MPVTELATLPLSSRVTNISDEDFRAKLRATIQTMENALGIPGRRFVYYQGVENERSLYLLGDWRSAAEHWEDFIPSAANQDQLALVRDSFDLPGVEMHHVDVPIDQVPTDAEVLSIERHRVRAGEKRVFEERFKECRAWLDRYVSREGKPVGGWRIEKAAAKEEGEAEEEEEWVLFCGWESVEEHGRFAGTEGFKQYARIQEFVQSFEVKHGKRIAL